VNWRFETFVCCFSSSLSLVLCTKPFLNPEVQSLEGLSQANKNTHFRAVWCR
jgi:hypothetical protein